MKPQSFIDLIILDVINRFIFDLGLLIYFLWRSEENYLLIIIKYQRYIFLCVKQMNIMSFVADG